MNLIELYGRLVLDASEYKKGLQEANEETEKQGSSMSSSAEAHTSKIGTALSGLVAKVTKAAAAATAAVGAGLVALGKQAITSYADYEQLVGGVETLFGEVDEAQNLVLSNAANAWKNQGISMNEYMEQVTGFAASLKQGLGGDLVAAAEAADTALTDISDNANKMGTDMSSLQNAYAGFAKGNFTMLDNLKLGYGGTASEMVRLINDSGVLKEEIDSMDDVSFDTIIAAIHEVQTNLGITGTTAKEAETTISGSLNALKSAWSNMLTGIADDDADFGTLIDNLVTSAQTAAGNIVPRIETTMNGIVSLVEGLAPTITTEVANLAENTLPGLIDTASTMVTGLVDGLAPVVSSVLPTLASTLLPNLVSAGVTIISSLADTLVPTISETFPVLLNAVVTEIPKLATAIFDMLPSLEDTLIECMIQLAYAISDPEVLTELLTGAADCIVALADGLIEAMPEFIAAAPVIIQNLATAIVDSVPYILDSADEIVIAFVNGIYENFPAMVTAAGQMIDSLLNAIVDLFGYVNEKGEEVDDAIAEGIANGLQKIKDKAQEIVQSIKDKIESFAGDWVEAGGNVIKGFINGITGSADEALDSIGEFFGNVVSKAKSILGIASPSKVFKRIGEFGGQGFSNGFAESMQAALGVIADAFDDVNETATLAARGVHNSIASELEAGYDKTAKTMQTNIVDAVSSAYTGASSTLETMLTSGDITLGFANKLGQALTAADLQGISNETASSYGVQYGAFVNGQFYSADALSSAFGNGALSASGLTSALSAQVASTETSAATSTSTGTVSSSASGSISVDTVIGWMEDVLSELKNMNIVLDTGELVGRLSTAIDYGLNDEYELQRRGVYA